jgi:hypothetical protein
MILGNSFSGLFFAYRPQAMGMTQLSLAGFCKMMAE